MAAASRECCPASFTEDATTFYWTDPVAGTVTRRTKYSRGGATPGPTTRRKGECEHRHERGPRSSHFGLALITVYGALVLIQ